MSQVVLDETEIHPRFKQVRGPRVAERVHRGALVDATGPQGGSKGILHAVARHGRRGGGHPKPAPAWGRKEPARMAVGAPVLT